MMSLVWAWGVLMVQQGTHRADLTLLICGHTHSWHMQYFNTHTTPPAPGTLKSPEKRHDNLTTTRSRDITNDTIMYYSETENPERSLYLTGVRVK